MRSRPRPAAHTAAQWEADIIPLLWARARGRCEVTGASLTGPDGCSVHHRKPRSAGGTRDVEVDSLANLLLVTGSGTTGAHGWLEHNRVEAKDRGLIVPRVHVARPEDVPVTLHDARVVLLSPTLPVYLPVQQ